MRTELRADCARCVGLCCVAPTFVASADFAIDKPAGRPCRHLQGDSRCGVHAELRKRGFPGCTVFDCFGAGQHLTQGTFGGRDWREAPETATAMFAGFAVMRQLHELLWHLTEACTLPVPAVLADDVRGALRNTRQLSDLGPAELAALEVPPHRQAVGVLLQRVSEHVRADLPQARVDRRGADLIGADLRGAALRGASLRGAYLIGADLRGADLRRADLLGADLRGADLRGADLRDSLFLTQPQVEAARGDTATGIPPVLSRPAHWAAAAPAGRRPGRRRR
ncbi:pentapeptide repeat-containing protein [Modestobacter lapidis]|nr:pentapeptide repeat-containing protein [Modestobacter lapidis]